MFTVQFKTERGAHQQNFYYSPIDAEAKIITLFNRRIEAVAKDSNGENCGGAWKMDDRWNWYFDQDAR